MSARLDFEPLTLPSVHRDDLPSCCGNCQQGRIFCPHPLACAGIEVPQMQTGTHRVVQMVPLKQPRIQPDPPKPRPQPASMDPVSTLGHRVLFWTCILGAVGAAYALSVN